VGYRARPEAVAAEAERQRRALAAAEWDPVRVSLGQCRDQELGVRFQWASKNSSGGSMGLRLQQLGAKLERMFFERGAKLEAEFEQNEIENCAKIDRHAVLKANRQFNVQAFLKEHGFSGVNGKRTCIMKSDLERVKSEYPLHSAVRHNNTAMVRMLLKNGADPALKSSAGLTPHQLALYINSVGSHDLVLSALTPQSSNQNVVEL